jgi:hypothetical protein
MTTTNNRPDLSSDGGPAIDKTILVNVKPKLMFGHETHMGLESRTYWPTDRQSVRDFDLKWNERKVRKEGRFSLSGVDTGIGR